ncbi:MAG: PAS domain-containing protein [Leptolyngbyaceae cyanobacterium bins.302]|nr:PAS domain-containing protein [Leptolyngbyaceae cyanobacterium bins.302]
MAYSSQTTSPPRLTSPSPKRKRTTLWSVLLLGALLLVVAHVIASFYRVQPGVSLWFPPSGVAIVLTFWLGPIGALITGIVSVLMAPLWGGDGWMRLSGWVDIVEPLVAWLLYRRLFRGSLTLHNLHSVIAFLLSAPLAACSISAALGCSVLSKLGRIPPADFFATVSHWWVGNAIGTMAIVPVSLLLMTPLLRQWGVLPQPPVEITQPFNFPPNLTRNQWIELIAILLSLGLLGLTTVQATYTSAFITLQFSLLGLIPIIWAACRFGVLGGVLAANLAIFIALIGYVLFYPSTIALAQSPVNAELLHLQQLNLLLQSAVALVVGTAITEWAAGQVALAVEQVRLKEYQASAQLSEKLFQLNRLLTESNQQLQSSEERFRTSVENMLDCFCIYSAIRDETGQIIDFQYDYLNEAACHNNRLSREEQIGKRLCELLPSHRTNGLFDDYCQVVETGRSLVKDEFIDDDIYGQQRLVRAFDIRATKFGDGLVVTWRDVTSRRQAHEELNQRQRFIERVTNTVPGVLYVYDLIQQRNVYANLQLAETLGYTPTEIQAMGQDLFPRLMHPDELALLPHQLAKLQALQDGEFLEFEFRMRHKHGEWRWLCDRATVFTRTSTGEPHQILGCAQDITDRKQTELALSLANEQFQLAATAIDSLIYDWDIESDYMIRTEGLMKVLGYSPDEAEPNNCWWRNQIHPSDLAHLPEGPSPTSATGDRYNLEYRVRHKQGHFVTVQDSGLILYRDDGTPKRVVGHVIDISDRKQAENALRESEERLRLALTAADQGLYDLNVQTGSAIVSPEYARMLGYDPDTFQETHQWWLERLHPDDLPGTTQAYEDYITGQRQDYRVEFRQRCQNGAWKWILSVGKIVQWDEAGQPLRMLGTHTDINDRKHSEEALQRSQERLNLALEAAGMGTWKWNMPANEVTWSIKLEEMFGLSPGTFNGSLQVFINRLHPEDHDRVLRTAADAVRRGTDLNVEFRILKPDGALCWLVAKGKVFHDREGNPLQMTGVTLDITERKRIEVERAQILQREQAARQQAESASRMKDEFLAIVSHELRSPLNAILGWSRLLRTRKMNVEKTEQALAIIERNAQAQTQLIEDLLDISRIIRGKIRLYPRPVKLVPILQAAIDSNRPTADTKLIQLEACLGHPNSSVSGDPERLQQVVWNLLSNAIKFTPNGGRVEVCLSVVSRDSSLVDSHWSLAKQQPMTNDQEQMTHYAQITVTDTGKGIAPEFLPQVFDRFAQADSTTTRNESGLGLGLAIVRNLVELHGGRVFADSAGVGRGATFTVELPLLPETPVAAQPFTGVRTVPGDADSLDGIRVLVVDDEADTRDFLVAALEQFGADVTAAVSVQDALNQITQLRPHVLLSDIGMPEQDGYELIQQLRTLPPEAGGTTPAAAITAYVRGEDRNQAIQAGFQLHVPKPIDPMQLLHVVQQLATLQQND